jgi:hypothetical protein
MLIILLGSLFSKRLKDAYAMREKHRLVFYKFSSTFPSQTVQKWEAMVLAWKGDKSQPNPYRETASGSPYCFIVSSLIVYILLATTLQDVRLELAREEAAEAARGSTSPHKVTLTTFLTTALELEEQQYVYAPDNLHT